MNDSQEATTCHQTHQTQHSMLKTQRTRNHKVQNLKKSKQTNKQIRKEKVESEYNYTIYSVINDVSHNDKLTTE